MFTAVAIVLVAVLFTAGTRGNNADRASYDQNLDASRDGLITLHMRQDIKLLVFLLAGVMVMLGIIADRIH